MTVPIPTVDQFSETTVMAVIRKIVDYLRNDLVDGINDNDIQSGSFTINGQQLSGTFTKGDGTTINIPAVTLPGSTTSNPYPTAVSMTLSGTTLNFSMTMSSGSPITASVDLSSIAGGGGGSGDIDIDVVESNNSLGINIKDGDIKIGGYSISFPSINLMQITANDEVLGDVTKNQLFVEQLSTYLTDNNELVVTVNNMGSTPLALPSGGISKVLQTENVLTNIIEHTGNNLNILADFDIEFIRCNISSQYVKRVSFYKGSYSIANTVNKITLGSLNDNEAYILIDNDSGIPRVYNGTNQYNFSSSETPLLSGTQYIYRIFV